MGAIADFSAYKEFVANGTKYNLIPRQIINSSGNSILNSQVWTEQFGGTAPSTPAVCTVDTTGGLLEFPKLSTTTAQKWIALIEAVQSASNAGFLLYDRLSHQGGLVANVATPQTTNLPTAALTRYTDGVGVCIAFTIYASIGGTASDLTVTYTNQAGTSGRTSKPIAMQTTVLARVTYIVPLADGDTGVRSVESITLSASTGTAGNVGISLIKPLFIVPPVDLARVQANYALGLACGKLIEIVGDACICALLKTNSNPHMIEGQLVVAET